MTAVSGVMSRPCTPLRDCHSGNGSDNTCVNTPKRRTPSLTGSAKFRRVSSGKSNYSCTSPHSVLSIEDKFTALQDIFSENLLITELRGKNSATDNHYDLQEEDEEVSEEEGDDDTFIGSDYPDDGHHAEIDYETDLEMDYDEWINDDKKQVKNDLTGEGKYIEMCNVTGVIPVTYFVKHIEDREFRMKFHGLGPLGAKAIAYPMKSNRQIEVLNLEGNWIMGEGSEYLARMLMENFFITELYLAENRIGNSGAEAMAEMLVKNDSICTLDLSGNEIEDSGAEKLCTTLLRNSSIKHLFLAHNRLEEKAAMQLKELLSHNENIETLDLSWNHFRTKGAVALAEGIMENYGLKCIRLAMNGFGYDGADVLGKALNQNRTLRELNVAHNRIPEKGAILIAAGLRNNDTLKTLRIGYNPLGQEGPLAILTEIGKNDISSMETLDCSNVKVTSQFQELQKQLETDRGMTIIHGGIIGDKFSVEYLTYDPLAEFRRDPVARLFEHARDAGYRMLDLFKDFDKDKSNSISRDEFIIGIQRAGMDMSVRQLEILVDKLDKDKDGSVDYSELLEADAEHRMKQREKKKNREAKSRGRSERRPDRTETLLTKRF